MDNDQRNRLEKRLQGAKSLVEMIWQFRGSGESPGELQYKRALSWEQRAQTELDGILRQVAVVNADLEVLAVKVDAIERQIRLSRRRTLLVIAVSLGLSVLLGLSTESIC